MSASVARARERVFLSKSTRLMASRTPCNGAFVPSRGRHVFLSAPRPAAAPAKLKARQVSVKLSTKLGKKNAGKQSQMSRRSQKRKTGNSSGSGSGKPHLACPPATEHRDVVRQIFESLNIQFERLRSDPVMRGQRDPTTLHNFAALLNRAVTPVTTEEKIVFETIRYLSDANRAKLCRWMFSAHLACISLCADERLVALGLNVPSDILVAMRSDGALVVRHQGPSGMPEFDGKAPASGTAAKPQEPPPAAEAQRVEATKPIQNRDEAQANSHPRGGNKLPTNPGAMNPVAPRTPGTKSGKSDTATVGRGSQAESGDPSSGLPVETAHGAKDAPIREDATLAGAATSRKRDAPRRPVIADARYQLVLESLKAAPSTTALTDVIELKKQGGEPVHGLTPAPQGDGAATKAAPASAPNTRQSPQSAARPDIAPTANGQPGLPQSYRDAAATNSGGDKKTKIGTGTPTGILRTVKSPETAPNKTGATAPNKTGATPTSIAAVVASSGAPKRVLSRVEEDTELLLDFIRAAPSAPDLSAVDSKHKDSDDAECGRQGEGSNPAPCGPARPAPQPTESALVKIVSWADAPSDEEDKEADRTVRRLQRPPLPALRSGSSEAKRSVPFARIPGRDARSSKDMGDKKSDRRGGRRRRRRDQSSAASNSA
jgi:hypothetical protein